MFSFTLPAVAFPVNTSALCLAEWKARKPAGQFCAQSAIITFPYEAVGIFPARKPTGIFFSVFVSLGLTKPPTSDIWCWWAITSASICAWFTACLNISEVQSDTALGALLDVKRPNRKWGLLRVCFCGNPWVLLLLQLQPKVLHKQGNNDLLAKISVVNAMERVKTLFYKWF